MRKYILILTLLLLPIISINAQGFKVKARGTQNFNLEDKGNRNQITFSSKTPLEDITGTVNAISGTVSFEVANFAKTLKGKVIVKVVSMNTGIELRNNHMKSSNWLDEKKYPEIIFDLKSVELLKQISDNKLEFKIKGDFTLHGVTKEIIADAEATYLDESEQTQKRAPGDLLGIHSTFKVKLSDFDVDNSVVGSKVSEVIDISVNIVGSNK